MFTLHRAMTALGFVLLAATAPVVKAIDFSEILSREESRTENVAASPEVAKVDVFSGSLTSSVRDIHLVGTGPDISVYRRFDSAGVRAKIWEGAWVNGATMSRYTPQQFAALGFQQAWTLTAAPVVDILVAHRPIDDLSMAMTDGLDKICTGAPFRANGTSGAYGTVIVYSLTLPDGSQEALVPVATGVVQSRNGWRMTCVGGQGGVHILQSPDGDKYTMGKKILNGVVEVIDNVVWPTFTYAATRRDDANGNWVTFSYADYSTFGDMRPQLSSITASDGRTLAFAYEAFTVPNYLSYTRVRSIATNSGATWLYAYDPSGKLGSVTDPGSRQWLYEYLPGAEFNTSVRLVVAGTSTLAQPTWAKGGLLSKITTPTGGSISIDYEISEVHGRGLWWWEGSASALAESAAQNYWAYPNEMIDMRDVWSARVKTKTTSDGGLWKYTYAPSNTVGQFDVTTVETPAGVQTHKFMGEGYFAALLPHGYIADYSTIYKPGAWKLGLPVEVRYGSSRVETMEWGSWTLSSIYYMAVSGAVGLRDDVTYVPALTKKTIVQDGETYTTTNSNFDAYGNPGTVVETGPNGGSRTTTRTYLNDTSKWIIGRLQDETFTGSSTTRTFDTNGNLLTYTRDGVTTTNTYDAQGNIATTLFPRGLQHSYSNYKRGIPQTEVQPEGINVTRVINDAGNIESETDGAGKTTSYTYDGLNRVKSVTYPVGNPKTFVYTPTSKAATRGSLVEDTQYDPFGRVASITLGGVVKTFGYDALGRKSFESNPGTPAVGTSYLYDELNRIKRVTNADASYQIHDYGPATKTVTDERGKVTTFAYRSYGDPTQQFLMTVNAPESSANVALTRNARDLIKTATQGSLTRTYDYNANYYLTSVTNPETGVTTYGRDAAGNMTSYQVGSSGVTTFDYDNRNRVKQITYPSGTPSVSKTYTKTDKLESSTSSSATRFYAYDNNGNLLNETSVIDGQGFVIGYAYNGNDQLSAITYPRSGRVISYAPNLLGLPTQASNFISNVSYWPSGQFKQITYANGTVSNYDQNSRLWPKVFDTKRGSTTYLQSAYDYDGLGNLKSITDSVDGSYNRVLDYDGINRLTSASGPWGSGTIEYDGVGNIKNQVLGGSGLYYTYVSNQLSTVSGLRAGSYGYDVFGNITTALGNTYSYDAVPNLRCVNCADGNTKVEYTYDSLNNRATVIKGGVKSYEVYGSSGSQLIEFTPAQSNQLVEYILLAGKRVAQIESPVNAAATLTLTGCTSVTPTTKPTAATMSCILGNSGSSAATGVVYSKPQGTSVSGPASCAANTANCGSVVVTTDTNAGTYAGTLIAVPTPSGTVASTPVSLTVIAGNPAVLSISPTSWALGSVKLAVRASQILTIANAGGPGPLTITKTDSNGRFSLVRTTCPADGGALAANSSCTVTISFTGDGQCGGSVRQNNAVITASSGSSSASSNGSAADFVYKLTDPPCR